MKPRVTTAQLLGFLAHALIVAATVGFRWLVHLFGFDLVDDGFEFVFRSAFPTDWAGAMIARVATSQLFRLFADPLIVATTMCLGWLVHFEGFRGFGGD